MSKVKRSYFTCQKKIGKDKKATLDFTCQQSTGSWGFGFNVTFYNMRLGKGGAVFFDFGHLHIVVSYVYDRWEFS